MTGRYVTTMRLIVLLVGALLLSPSLEAQEGRFEVREKHVSRKEAIGLSFAFPGLGQLATGHNYKGTALVAAEIGCLVVWLTSHADYNTRLDRFDLEQERYLALREGSSFEQAEESWQMLGNLKDDLDGSHTRRRLFGVLAVGVYGYNLVDVLLRDGATPAVGKKVSLVPLPVRDAPGAALVARF